MELQQEIASVLVDVLPEHAEKVILKIIKHGVRINFPRPATSTDAKYITKSLPQVKRTFMYNNTIGIPCDVQEERDKIVESFKDAHDEGRPRDVKAFSDDAKTPSGPLNFGAKNCLLVRAQALLRRHMYHSCHKMPRSRRPHRKSQRPHHHLPRLTWT